METFVEQLKTYKQCRATMNALYNLLGEEKDQEKAWLIIEEIERRKKIYGYNYKMN